LIHSGKKTALDTFAQIFDDFNIFWKRHMHRIILAFLLLITACSPASPVPTPTIPALSGDVHIVYPQDGATIYSEVLIISGTATTPDFALKLVAPDETIIAQTTIQSQADTWQIELVHSYNGEPIEVNVSAVPIDTNITTEYDTLTIVLSRIENRPEGIFGSITSPSEGGTVGGEVIPISGMASGLSEISLALIGSDGANIDSRDVALYNPYLVDDMPWTAELATNGYLGDAKIRITNNENSISSVDVKITSEAG
jgi:hypothetical protein